MVEIRTFPAMISSFSGIGTINVETTPTYYGPSANPDNFQISNVQVPEFPLLPFQSREEAIELDWINSKSET